MWDWVSGNWTTVLVLLALLACPLMHAFGHRGRHPGRPPADKPRA
jgi:hypothetical protein